jgi:hypothetical protein
MGCLTGVQCCRHWGGVNLPCSWYRVRGQLPSTGGQEHTHNTHTLSTTKAEYITMPQALRDIIPIMNLLQKMREQNFKVVCIKPYVYCKVFEYNKGALEPARLPKLRPRTKHINVCYHHFLQTRAKGALSRSSPSTPKTRLLTHSQKIWHKMTSSVIAAICAVRNLSKPPK